MDSGNSGSLQSSSGGDEADYHESARAAAVADSFSTAFFNHQANTNYPHATHVSHVTMFTQPSPPPSFFDPLASYLDQLSRSANPPDPVWPIGPDHRDLISPSSLETPRPSSSSSNAAHGQPGAQVQPARNPRKRTRASRRAPTTVLTTDTTNFRAMVQEFTGIPAPPFGSGGGGGCSSSSLFFPRTQLDLFGGGMHAPPGPNTGQLPPYLLRPLAQKISPPPLVSTVTTTIKSHGTDNVITASSSSGGGYQVRSGSDLGLLTSLYNPDPGSSTKPGSGSLELPVTTARNDDNVRDQLGGVLTAANSSGGKNNGGSSLGWTEGLGLGADAGAGEPAPSSNGPVNHNAPHHPHQRPPQNLGFAHQQIG